MKKFLTVLCMITCIFGLTACGATKQDMTYEESSMEAVVSMVYQNVCMENADAFLTQLQGMDSTDLASVEAVFRQYGIKVSGKVLMAGLGSYSSSAADFGQLSNIVSYAYDAQPEVLEVTAIIKGSSHDAKMELKFDKNMAITDITVNPVYSFGELMGRAGLNTLMGMGTVFAVLILISVIISCMRFIPMLQEKLTKKPVKEAETVVAPRAVQTFTPAPVEEEDLSDDCELAAVIAAAIAASQEAVSADGFVVRSIRRASGSKWKRA